MHNHRISCKMYSTSCPTNSSIKDTLSIQFKNSKHSFKTLKKTPKNLNTYIHTYWHSKNLQIIERQLYTISNFCRVLNVVCFLLGNSPASEYSDAGELHSDAGELPRRKHTTALYKLDRQLLEKITHTCSHVHHWQLTALQRTMCKEYAAIVHTLVKVMPSNLVLGIKYNYNLRYNKVICHWHKCRRILKTYLLK